MLSIFGQNSRLCGGLSRRQFLTIGGLSFGAGGFGLADLLRAEATSGKSTHKGLINIFLGGGPPQWHNLPDSCITHRCTD